ncbi:MAG: transposase [Coraliomargarita sp.]
MSALLQSIIDSQHNKSQLVFMSQDFLNPFTEIDQHGGKLPYWQQDEALQFVTFRLKDSVPTSKLREWANYRKQWLLRHPQPWDSKTQSDYHCEFSLPFESWLDRGYGECILKDSGNRQILSEIFMHDQNIRVTHLAWINMPNHVHLLFKPLYPLAQLIKTWKGVSARKIGNGSIWQRNYRDTIIRNPEHRLRVLRYIRKNPSKLSSSQFTLWESDEARCLLKEGAHS